MNFRVCMAVLLAITLMGCAKESDPVAVKNSPPTITFTFTPIAVPRGIDVNLTVGVADSDEGDNLTVTWEVSPGGTLTPQNAQKSVMRWDTPTQIGDYTFTVMVSDGEDASSVTEVVRVGTLLSGSGLPNLSPASSPYILRPDESNPIVIVDDFDTKTLDAGVEVLVDVLNTSIFVTGTLELQGTAEDPVVFKYNDRNLTCTEGGRWDGITVASGGEIPTISNGLLLADYAAVWYAAKAVRLSNSGSAEIRNCSITCGGGDGVFHGGNGSLIIEDCDITNIQGSGVAVTTTTQLPSLVSITGSNISINSIGILLDLNDQFQDVPIAIEGNKLDFNAQHGITMERWVWPTIHCNNFSANGGGSSNIRLQGLFFHDAANPDSLDVSCNYWGAALSSQSSIENTIRDRLDSQGLGTRLLVTPWLNQDPFKNQAVCDACQSM